MRSRNYYAIAGSSLLLLSISCLKQGNSERDLRESPIGDFGGIESGSEGESDLSEDRMVSVQEDPPLLKNESSTESGRRESLKIHSDGCASEEMPFEGKCVSKGRVQKVVDHRERDALEKYKTAKKPQQAAEAAHELMEQQVAQIGKTEDDLDEILEILREEDRKNAAKKGDL